MSTPPPISCQELTELVTPYLELTLETREHARLETHLAACEDCVAYVEQLRVTRTVLGRVEPEVLSPGAREELAAAFAAWRAERP